MAAKKVAAATNTEAQQKQDILTGIIDKDTRIYTMQRSVTVNGEKRDGTFRFRYPTVGDRLRQGVLQAKFLGNTPVDSIDLATYNIAYAMSFLAATAVQLPPWFMFENMEDVLELQAMYVEVNAFVDSFRTDAEPSVDAGNSEVASGKETVANS